MPRLLQAYIKFPTKRLRSPVGSLDGDLGSSGKPTPPTSAPDPHSRNPFGFLIILCSDTAAAIWPPSTLAPASPFRREDPSCVLPPS